MIQIVLMQLIPTKPNRGLPNGLVVFGLATSHHEEIKLMQVRPAGQAGYPISLVASLDAFPVKCCVPLLEISIHCAKHKKS